MKLICEAIEEVQFIKEESESGKKNYYLQGPFLECDTGNRNGRIYPEQVLVKEVANYTDTFINKKRALGELGHPAGPTINLERVSHIIESLKQDGKMFIGRALLLETPYGNIAKNFIDNGVKFGMSSRGIGSLVNRGNYSEVQPDYKLFTVDIVHDPSASSAFVEGVMEGVDWIFDAGEWSPKFIEKAQKFLNTSYGSVDRQVIEEAKIATWKNFLFNLKTK